MRTTLWGTWSGCKGEVLSQLLLRYRQLLKDTNVRFSGYRKPHPLENMVEIKVQTDGSKTPAMAVIEACDKTLNHITAIQNSFEVSDAADIFSLLSETISSKPYTRYRMRSSCTRRRRQV